MDMLKYRIGFPSYWNYPLIHCVEEIILKLLQCITASAFAEDWTCQLWMIYLYFLFCLFVFSCINALLTRVTKAESRQKSCTRLRADLSCRSDILSRCASVLPWSSELKPKTNLASKDTNRIKPSRSLLHRTMAVSLDLPTPPWVKRNKSDSKNVTMIFVTFSFMVECFLVPSTLIY